MLGPYSRPHRLRRIDRRTTLGKYICDFEAGLISHTGGQPSFAIRALIDQAVSLEVQLMLLERAGIKTDLDRRCYASWLNAKRNLLKAVGLKPAADEKPKPAPTPTAEHESPTKQAEAEARRPSIAEALASEAEVAR